MDLSTISLYLYQQRISILPSSFIRYILESLSSVIKIRKVLRRPEVRILVPSFLSLRIPLGKSIGHDLIESITKHKLTLTIHQYSTPVDSLSASLFFPLRRDISSLFNFQPLESNFPLPRIVFG